MTLKNNVLRHQLMLMRLVRTQARVTKKYLKEAEALVIKAIETGKYGSLYINLVSLFANMPKEALNLIKDLAVYEVEWMQRHLNTNRNIVIKIPKDLVLEKVPKIKVSMTTGKKPETIQAVYKEFATKKSKQFVQIVKDAQVVKEDKEETISKISEKTNGLFTMQNLALAGLAIMGTANMMRADVADANNLLVDWSLDLELNNCPYCIDKADGSPYAPSDVEGEIPVHANCGCTLVPVE